MRGHGLWYRVRSGILDLSELVPASTASWIATHQSCHNHHILQKAESTKMVQDVKKEEEKKHMAFPC